MPKITSLKAAVHQANRVNVFIDGKYDFSLTLSELADVKLFQGKELSKSELESLRVLSGLGKLYQSTLEYCYSRPHSKKEIIDFLERKRIRRDLAWKRYQQHQSKLAEDENYAEEVKQTKKQIRELNQKIRTTDFTEDNTFEYIGAKKTNLPTKPADRITDQMITQIVLRLESQNIIDDSSFARFYIENRHLSKGISRRRLIQELRQKGISDETIQVVLSVNRSGESPRDERQEIQKMIKKRASKTTDRNKLTAYLARQGFSYNLIKTELDHFLHSAADESFP